MQSVWLCLDIPANCALTQPRWWWWQAFFVHEHFSTIMCSSRGEGTLFPRGNFAQKFSSGCIFSFPPGWALRGREWNLATWRRAGQTVRRLQCSEKETGRYKQSGPRESFLNFFKSKRQKSDYLKAVFHSISSVFFTVTDITSDTLLYYLHWH